MSTTIADQWKHFWKAIRPIDAGKFQESEMRKSFYAGFMNCFSELVATSNGMTEKQALKKLDRYKKEMEAFTIEMFEEAKRKV